MQLKSIHPGVTFDDVRENTGFDIFIPTNVTRTEPPTVKEVNLLRSKINPRGIR